MKNVLQYKPSFNFKDLLADIIAGLTTSLAALALGAAFGIQSGRGVVAGMIAAALIPITTSILGGTRLQASGPTAPLTAVSVVLINQAGSEFDNPDLANQFITLTLLLMGLILVLSGVLRLGKYISLIPQVVVLGFMNGIALLIWRNEILKIFGTGETLALGYRFLGITNPIEKLDGPVIQNLLLAITTLALILTTPILVKKFQIPEKIRPFIPGTLVGILAATSFFVFANWNLQTVETANSLKSPLDLLEIPNQMLPTRTILQPKYLARSLPIAIQLAVLAYLDSLLTSLVIDKLTKEETKKEKELVAQGLGNIVSGLFGGIPGAQATIRSVILLKEGARTRLSGVLVGIFTLLGIFLLQDWLGLVASAIFVGVLLKAGWDVLDKDFVLSFWKNPKKYLIQAGMVLLVSLVTLVWNLNIAVVGGTIIFYLAQKYFQILDYTDSQELLRED